jgi:hypothetical protein
MTGGQNSQPIYSGDPQAGLPRGLKGSKIGDFLQMLGLGGGSGGGGLGGGTSILSDMPGLDGLW